ncbi:transcriptional regulator, TetR family [Geodermatophilus obscurus]|uniref:Transcriptional regulator, TetR family n=1 Tax=Geodermatophilus obscurus TaxID=1861 RepID=A0A1M7S178_9ACTN|nr:TetR/AcrR family transcriptional regulator [Geodermatophilus obscurus]SHN52104.1 transcriptional regulator, TetR family [Geodermatophilus obscurus]
MHDVTGPSDRLLDCVLDLLVAEGYEGISIRRVAAAAGVSIGAVQHHFATKDALLAAAMDRISQQFQERLDRRIAPGAGPPEVLRAVADELVSTGAERRPASVIWLVRMARAAVHEPTAEVHRREWQQVEDLLALLIATARPDLAEQAVRDEATVLLALLDGLAGAVAVEPARVPADRAEALVARHLDALLDPVRPSA